jgi:hypothetical protein
MARKNDGERKNLYAKAQELLNIEGRAHLDDQTEKMRISSVQDPFTGTVHADLSDPDHPFHKSIQDIWNEEERKGWQK